MGMKPSNGLRNMTVGSPAGHLFAFALPLLLGSFLQQLYNMVDAWVVGKYVGDAALAAVGIGFPVLFMFSSLF
ncbi:Multi antimicrobial extrusion protein MatE, partial [gut metagenome]